MISDQQIKKAASDLVESNIENPEPSDYLYTENVLRRGILMAVEDSEGIPRHIQEALNSGDGTYKP